MSGRLRAKMPSLQAELLTWWVVTLVVAGTLSALIAAPIGAAHARNAPRRVAH